MLLAALACHSPSDTGIPTPGFLSGLPVSQAVIAALIASVEVFSAKSWVVFSVLAC
jgi:hypothetical protein